MANEKYMDDGLQNENGFDHGTTDAEIDVGHEVEELQVNMQIPVAVSSFLLSHQLQRWSLIPAYTTSQLNTTTKVCVSL